HDLAKEITKRYPYFDTKVTVVGHMQRGGAPSYFDRVLASKMGVAAVEGLIDGKAGVMVGIKNNEIVYNDFNTISNGDAPVDKEALRISKILSI
ncbi:MAG TPA: 6-phosphofructokinase, partial [Cyclobacteriaceae bacterium]|nr:6-phosphofructokinase [Cyclobacteriaceae bacterium]